METKIAILRGINVGGKRRILMKDLVFLCEELGLKDVTTYIQSGNIIFKSEEVNKELEEKLENLILDKYGFDVPVIIRTSGELKILVDRNPFYGNNDQIEKLHLTLLKEEPKTENKKHAESFHYAPDVFVIDEKDVFVFCEGKYHQSKLSNSFFESKLKVEATTRNWKTVLKLAELSNE